MIRIYLRYVPRYPISDARKKEMVFISQGTHLISEVRARVLFYFIQAYTYLGIYLTLQKVFQILRYTCLNSKSGRKFLCLPYLHEVDICSKDLPRLLPILTRRDKGYRLTAGSS